MKRKNNLDRDLGQDSQNAENDEQSESSQQPTTFLFTSESVGEGHPGMFGFGVVWPSWFTGYIVS